MDSPRDRNVDRRIITAHEGDRDLVVHQAQETFATGQISQEDLVAHLDVVLTAHTSTDLVPVLAELP